jgi:hypothetical protein
MENTNNPMTREAIEFRHRKLTDEQWDFLWAELTDTNDYGDDGSDDLVEDWLTEMIANIDFYMSPYVPRAEQVKPE